MKEGDLVKTIAIYYSAYVEKLTFVTENGAISNLGKGNADVKEYSFD